MPRLAGVREHRWVAPGDVLATDVVVDDETDREKQRARYAEFVLLLAMSDEILRDRLSPYRSNQNWQSWPLPDVRVYLKKQIDTYGPSEERTVLVKRLVT